VPGFDGNPCGDEVKRTFFEGFPVEFRTDRGRSRLARDLAGYDRPYRVPVSRLASQLDRLRVAFAPNAPTLRFPRSLRSESLYTGR